jgi:type IV pilus assembly protein PilE
MSMAQTKKSRGFTLIELMIALAIVGILAAVAFPSYKNHIKKGARVSAEASVMDIANRQQQYLLNNRIYATKDQLAYTLPTDVSKNYSWDVETSSSTSAPPAFTITFTPLSSGVMSGDGDLKLNNSGTKSSNW